MKFAIYFLQEDYPSIHPSMIHVYLGLGKNGPGKNGPGKNGPGKNGPEKTVRGLLD